MKKLLVMKNITRIEQEKKKQFGWWVRVRRDGENFQKFFSDLAHGGKNSALLAAMAFRDSLIEKHPMPEHGNMFNRANSRNSSGYPGVHKTTQNKRGQTYEVWTAAWTLPDGKRVTRKFHFSDEGRSEKEARLLAIKAREEGLKMIDRMRRGLPKKGKKKGKKGAANGSTQTSNGSPRRPSGRSAGRARASSRAS